MRPGKLAYFKKNCLCSQNGDSSHQGLISNGIGLVCLEYSVVITKGVNQFPSSTCRFRTGPGVAPSTVPQDVENLVLVLNGRETSKIEAAVMWLDYVDKLLQLKNLAVVLLGNEQCNNDWIHRYMYKNGGPVKFVFLVYDSPEIDDFTFYQWPLGVAT